MDHELLIEAGHTERNYWRDLFRYRELFYFLAWRDVLVRYKQTVIGILWAVLRPFLTMVIFVFVFSRVACREILASHRNRETVSSIVTTNDRRLPNEAFAIAKQLHEGLAAEQVYLYGSHACGEETASSDLDFPVVVPHSTKSRYERAVAALRIAGDVRFPKDIIVLTRAEWKKELKAPCSLSSTVLREGILLNGESSPIT